MARLNTVHSADDISDTKTVVAHDPTTPAAIELKNVSKEFLLESGEKVLAVDDVSLRIERSEFVCVVGTSGHGKSTMLNMIAGFFQPTHGTVFTHGKPVNGPGPDRGVVFQRDTLFPWRRIGDNIGFGLDARGVPRIERDRIVRHYAETIGLEKFINAWPKQLSGGMRRRVAIASVFANEPDVLLMDEPFVGLDYVRRAQLHKVLLDLWEESGNRAVYMITHDIDEAFVLADRILVVSKGRIVHDIIIDFERPRTTNVTTGGEASRIRREIFECLEV